MSMYAHVCMRMRMYVYVYVTCACMYVVYVVGYQFPSRRS